MICVVDSCNSPARVHKYGLCNSHHLRFLRHGNPIGGGTSPNSRIKFINSLKTLESDDCLAWPFGLNPKGYGSMSLNGNKTSAQRAIALICHGDPGPGVWHAAHSCGNGNKGCCNPKHIRWATPSENETDKFIHGTSNHGSRNGQAKLEEIQVLEIFKSSLSVSELASQFKVSSRAIRDIKSGRRWGWLTQDR